MLTKFNEIVPYLRKTGKDKFGNLTYSVGTTASVRYCKGGMAQKITATGIQTVFQKLYHAPLDLNPVQGDILNGMKVVEVAESVGADGKIWFWRVWCE